MTTPLSTFVADALGISARTREDRAVLQQRFAALKKQFPWVYATLAANLLALQVSVVPADYPGFNPTLAMLAVLAARLIYWARLGNTRVPNAKLPGELLKSYVIACVVCTAFCLWVLRLHYLAAANPAPVIIFSSLTSVGAFYGLSSFPAAARAPVYFLGAPVAVALVLSGDTFQVSVGLTLSLLMVLMLRMLEIQDRTFVRLVVKNLETEAARENAVQAERSAVEEQIRVGVIANTDPLTGLFNRRGFLAAVANSLTSAAGRALVIFDLDGFKPINDTFGHEAGDRLLVEVARRLAEASSTTLSGESGIAGRLGGDEFALLIPAADLASALQRASEVVSLLAVPYIIGSKKMRVSSCAGVSFRPTGGGFADMMREADIALYASKAQGRGVVQAFSQDMQRQIQRKTKIEQALRQPGLIDAIDLAFQPIFNLVTMELRSFEALARWKHSELGWISPAEFIPITEQISSIDELSDSLLRRAAASALSWPSSVKLSFNLSSVQISSVGAGDRVLAIIAAAGFPASRLQVELTETTLLADFAAARGNLETLRQAGASIVLDDFGAGFASISYLREINFDAIKLDGSLMNFITEVGPALPLLNGVLALCQSMGRQCIAEHIETEAQLRILQQFGCRYGQGYLLGRPMGEDDAKELVCGRVIDFPRAPARQIVG